MILDGQLQFSNDQALTATAVSTNVVDLSVKRDIGIGEAMAVVVSIGVDADYTTTDETYQVVVQTDGNEGFASPTDLIASQVYNGDQLTQGVIVVLPIGYENEQYLRVNYVLAGTSPSVTVDAYLQPLDGISGYTYYEDGFNIT